MTTKEYYLIAKKIVSAFTALLLALIGIQTSSTSANSQEIDVAYQMPGTNSFYAFVPNRTSWLDAYATASSMTFNGVRGHLANITSAEENAFVFSLGLRGWLGAKRDESSNFAWVDGIEAGQPLLYSNWGQNEPNGTYTEPYLEGAGKWNDNGTGEIFGFFVEFEAPRTEEVQGPVSLMPGTQNFYKPVLNWSGSWNSANSLAEASTYMGTKGHLVSITSAAENEFVRRLASGQNIWLGGKSSIIPSNSGERKISWNWAGGPEKGISISACDASLTPTCSGSYSNWDDTSPSRQPDLIGEDSLAMLSDHPQTNKSGSWHDCYGYGGCQNAITGFVIEFDKSLDRQKKSEYFGYSGHQGRKEAYLGTWKNQLLVTPLSGDGWIAFLNPNTLKEDKRIATGLTGLHFSYAISSSNQLFLLNSSSNNGTWIREYNEITEQFGAPIRVCQNSGYDNGIEKNGLLYITCKNELVVLRASDLSVSKIFNFLGFGVQPTVSGDIIWQPTHDSNMKRFNASTGEELANINGCQSAQSAHAFPGKIACVGLKSVSVFSEAGELLSTTSLPYDSLGAYYRAQDKTGVWVVNMTQNFVSHFNVLLGRFDKFLPIGSSSTGLAVLDSTLFVAGGDGYIYSYNELPQLSLQPTPLVAGAGKVGVSLRGNAGVWEKGVELRYQWLRDGEAIPESTAKNYNVSPLDYGKSISLSVSASKVGHLPAIKVSDSVFIQPLNLGLELKGSLKVGQKVVASMAPRSSRLTYTFEWMADGMPLPGQVMPEYRLAPQDAGKEVSVRVCAKYQNRDVTCEAKTAVNLVGKASMRAPSIALSGLGKVGTTLVSTIQLPSSSHQVIYQWRRNGVDIADANTSTYLTTALDRGKSISLFVVVSNVGYFDVSKTSGLIKIK